jgi:hypothetical protein
MILGAHPESSVSYDVSAPGTYLNWKSVLCWDYMVMLMVL